MRKRERLVLLGAVLFVATVASADVPRYAGKHILSDLVTDDCLVFSSIPSLKAAAEALKQLSPYKLFNDPEIQQLIRMSEKALDDALRGDFSTTASEARAAAARYLDLFDRQCSVAFLGVEEESPDFVVLLESSRGSDAVKKLLHDVVSAEVFERYLMVTPKKVKIGGADAFVCEETDGMSLAVCARENFLILASSRDRLAKTLAALDERLNNSLSASETFKRARGAVAADGAHCFFFANLSKVWERVIADDPHDEDLAKARRVLGFDFIAGAVSFEGGRAISRVHVVAEEGQKNTLLSYVGKRSNPLETLELISDRAVFFASCGLNLPKIISEISEAEDLFDDMFRPGQAERAAKKKLLEQTLKALAGSVQEEVSAFAQLPYGGGMWPEGALLFRTRDPASLEQDITDLLKLAGNEAKPVRFLNANLYMLTDQGPYTPFRPALSVIGRNAALSYMPQIIKTLIRQKKSPANLLRDKASFRNALDQMPPEALGVVYVDTRSIALYLYNTMTPFLPMMLGDVGEAEPRFDPALLPTPQTLAQYFSEMVVTAHREGPGLTVHISSDGFEPASLCAHAQVFAPYYLPFVFLHHRQEMARRCRSRLYMKHVDKETDLPVTQKEFVQKHMYGREALVCPADPNPVDLGDGFKSSYEYFPERYGVKVRVGPNSFGPAATEVAPPLADSDTIILYDNKPRHSGGRNVLTPRRHKWTSEEEFQERIEKQRARFGKK